MLVLALASYVHDAQVATGGTIHVGDALASTPLVGNDNTTSRSCVEMKSTGPDGKLCRMLKNFK